MSKLNAPRSRTLNIEEKRKLEKLLLSDIDTYIAQFKAARSKQREPVEKSAVTNAPAEVKALLTLNLNAKKEVARTASELDRHGYSVGSYGAETDKLKVSYSPKPKPLADFDAQTAKSEAALGELKRTYTFKLFAGGGEAKELFESLAQELNRIVK